jgi:RNA polymerase sigma-70 factor (ECF subfamily)
MNPEAAPSISNLLQAWGDGDEHALQELMPLVYEELRRRARNYLAGEPPGITLQPTALVNEAFLRLAEGVDIQWQDRAHFFAVAARIMRRILVDAARARRSEKRGGDALRTAFDERLLGSPMGDRELLALDDALDALGRRDTRKAKVVELRFFGGLSLQETAEVLQVSEDTVGRDWNFAKSWLAHEMK